MTFVYMKTNIPFWSYLAQFLLKCKMFLTNVVEKIETNILCSKTIFRKSYILWDNVEKYCRAGNAADGIMAHAHCMLHNIGFKPIFRICSTLGFSTAKQLHVNASMLPYNYISFLVYGSHIQHVNILCWHNVKFYIKAPDTYCCLWEK